MPEHITNHHKQPRQGRNDPEKPLDSTFRFITENMKHGVLIVAENRDIVYCNPRFGTMLDSSAERIVESSIFDIVSKNDQRQLADLLRLPPQREQVSGRLSFISGNGDTVDYPLSAGSFKMGEIKTICMVIMDDTEKQLQTCERTLHLKNQELKDRAEQLWRLSSELTLSEQKERQNLAAILHDDLQRLLVSAIFNLETLDGKIAPEYWKTLGNTMRLIEESLELSRSLTIELSPPILQEGDIVQSLEWLIRWIYEKYGFTVTLIEKDVRGIAGPDETRVLLFYSVRILLLNAIRHAQIKTAIIEITTLGNQMDNEMDEEYIKIEVSDQGAGFDPDILNHDISEDSAGLGLFRLKERILLIGGEFEITSTPQRGTTVTLIAPLRKAAPDKKGEDSTAVRLSSPAPESPAEKEAGSGIRVMLVDDHAVMRQGLSMLLSNYDDIEVSGEAADGEEAVKMARELNPDVILMDISMPKMNGIEATRIIHSELPHISIIGLSMFDAADQAAAIKEAGASHYLKKSGNKNELLNTIREVR